ncbi:MAG: hypothetical protein LBG07_09455 [Treponema sp.]|jgi:hypothetical protein|nr:hypothetical protein [Treponema sp.]
MRIALCIVIALFPAPALRFLSAEPALSGYLDSSVSLGAGAGDSPGFIYGLEEYANIRLQAEIREEAVFYGSFNLIASSGTYARAGALLASSTALSSLGLNPSALAAGENYAAGMELERLYFKVSRGKAVFQGGLVRMAFGWGLAFGPMDFLNPRNPLLPDARPRAVLGGDLAYYPAANAKIQAFSAAARDPFAASGAGTLAGLAGEYHGGRLSVQGLYAYESPHNTVPQGVHRFGLSLKGDFFAGLAAEMLYTFDPRLKSGEGGLAASLGLDYFFLDGDLYILAEYLYSGDGSSTVSSPGFTGNHYLFVNGLYRLSDYTSLNLGCMAALGDLSFTPVLALEHELFQGFTLSLNCQIPLDRSLSGGAAGEFGPLPPGAPAGRYFQSTVKTRLRF